MRSRVRLRRGTSLRPFLIDLVIQVVQTVAPDGSRVRLVFVVKLFLGTRDASWSDSSEEAAETAVGLVDSFVLAFPRAR
jgi:hypothetical protein